MILSWVYLRCGVGVGLGAEVGLGVGIRYRAVPPTDSGGNERDKIIVLLPELPKRPGSSYSL